MLGLRRNTPTRAEQISSELGECRDHLREVASLIAGGAAERFAPRVEHAREHAREIVHPKIEKARGVALHGLESMTSALGGEQKHKHSWPKLIGVLGMGLAAGAIGVLVMQRRHHHWHEYEPDMSFGAEETVEKAKDMAHTAKHTVADVGGAMREAAGDVKDTVKKAAENVVDSVATGAKKLKS